LLVHDLLLPLPAHRQVLPLGMPLQLQDDDPEQNTPVPAGSLSQQPL
jgi:hypothetical protein